LQSAELSLSLSVRVASLGFSLVDATKQRRELAYMRLAPVSLSVMQSAVEVELELVVERVQLDNQAPSAALPVVSNLAFCV